MDIRDIEEWAEQVATIAQLTEQVAILQRSLRHAQGVIDQLLSERAGYQSPREQALDTCSEDATRSTEIRGVGIIRCANGSS